MNSIDKNKEILLEEITNISGLESHKIRNIYIYGSRIYKTHTVNSDYDAIVIACSMYLNHEIYDNNYNIHITTPDSFADQLKQHDIHCLECIFAPDNAQIYSKIDYLKDFKFDAGQLKKMILSQSTWAWTKAQKRIEKGNIIGGAKSLFHSLRILNFGLQIMEFGKIVNFSASNETWNILRDCNSFEWNSYQDTWIPVRKGLMKLLKNSGIGNTGIFIRPKQDNRPFIYNEGLKCEF